MPNLENNAGTGSPDSPAPNFAAAAQTPYLRTLFFGTEGLRPGWGFVFYVAMFYALEKFGEAWTSSLRFGSASELWSMMVSELTRLIAALIPAVVLWRIERRRWAEYGLPLRLAFGRLFWIGALWGFAGISLLLGILYSRHAFSLGHLALHGVRIAKFAAFWTVLFLLVGLFEEFLVRGYSQFTLARGIGFWPSALALSCVFALMHRNNEGESWVGLLAVVVIALFLCLTLRRTGNLWFAVGFHAAWDWGETFFYSVPDSGSVFPGHLWQASFSGPAWLTGGSVGPEASVLSFMVIGAAGLLFERVYRPSWRPPRAKA